MKPAIHISSITLIVANLAKSIKFYEGIGLSIPPCLHPVDHIVIELQNKLDIVLQQCPQLENPLKSPRITLNIIVDRNEEVDAMIERAVTHGGEYIQHNKKKNMKESTPNILKIRMDIFGKLAVTTIIILS